MHVLANIIRLALLALLFVTPWLFGGVWARVQWVLMLVAAVLLAFDLVTRFGEDDRPNLVPSAWLPLLAGIMLGLFQLIPWSPGLAPLMASGAVAWRGELLGDPNTTPRPEANLSSDEQENSPDAVAAEATKVKGPVRRTLYTVVTREYLALLTLAMAVFVLASVHLVDRQSAIWFFCAMAGCGAALSFFGLIQRLSWNGKFYWFFEPLDGSFVSFGPFVNRNNAGGFLNLCLAAGLGLLVWVHWSESSPWNVPDDSTRSDRRRHRGRRRSSSSDRSSRPSRSRREPRSSGSSRVREGGPDSHGAPSVPESASSPTEPSAPNVSGGEPPPTDLDPPRGRPVTSGDDVRPGDSTRAEKDLLKAYQRSEHRRSPTGSRRSESSESHGKRPTLVTNPTAYESPSKRAASDSLRTIHESISGYVADLNAPRVASLAMVAATAGGVLCTASRGSILAMFAAAMLSVTALAFRRGNRGYAAGLLVILVAGMGLMSWAGQTEFVRARFADTFAESQYETGRIPNWLEALQAVPQFSVAGTGLGTYRLVYERFQERFLRDIVHTHAENQFIQALVEGGWIAVGLLLAAIGLTSVAVARLYRTGGPVNTALAITGTFALVSQFVGGMFDFGLYIPSNTMLMAAICGVVVGRAALMSVWPAEALDSLDSLQRQAKYVVPSASAVAVAAKASLTDERRTISGATRSRRAVPLRRSTLGVSRSLLLGLSAPATMVTLVVGFLLLGCLFGSLEMNKAGKIESALRRANLTAVAEMTRPEDVAAAAAPLTSALPQRWGDAEAHQALAQLRIQEYRAETYQRLLAEKAAAQATAEARAAENEGTEEAQADAGLPAGAEAPEVEALDPDLWARASLTHLHGTLRQLERDGQAQQLEALRNDSWRDEMLPRAVRHLRAARQAAPTLPRVHFLLAELSAVDPQLGDEQTHLHRAQLLSPGDATLWYLSGILDLNSGRVEQACEDWHRSLLLSQLHLDDIMRAAQGRLTVRQLLEQTLPAQADVLLQVAQRHFGGEERARYRQIFLARAEECLPQTELPTADLAYTHGAILRLLGRGDEAVGFYADAISRRSNNLAWRYEFARLLVDVGEYEKAREQAVHLIRAAPENGGYQRLLELANKKLVRQGTPLESSQN